MREFFTNQNGHFICVTDDQTFLALTVNKNRKPSIRKKLELAKERTAKHREREKTKHKDRGQEL